MARPKKAIDDPILVSEAARILGVSEPRIFQLITAGRLRAERYGPLRRLSRREVEAFARLDRPAGNPNFLAKKPQSRA